MRNESLNRIKRANSPTADAEVLADIATIELDPEDRVLRLDHDLRLREFLASTLDETELRVFTLHFGDDMPLDAITRLLTLKNTSGAKAYIVSAKRKLSRAAARLRARGEEL